MATTSSFGNATARLRRSSASQKPGSDCSGEVVAMTEKSDRKELERRLQQARRIRLNDDPLTKEKLSKLILDLEEQLR
jgi:hypothetical protein